MSEINFMILTVFRRWQKRNVPRGIQVDYRHVLAFMETLCEEGETLASGSYETIYGALRQAGVVPELEEHIWIGR